MKRFYTDGSFEETPKRIIGDTEIKANPGSQGVPPEGKSLLGSPMHTVRVV